MLFPFLFIGMWCAVSLFLSSMGGWGRLAKTYSAHQPPTGKRVIFQAGKVGEIYYKGCLIAYSSAEGLYLSVFFPFRLGHPPLFFPWDVLCNRTTRRTFFGNRVEIAIGPSPITKVELPQHLFDDQSPPQEPVPSSTSGNVALKKPLLGPMSCFIAGIVGCIQGALIRRRVFPFLREDTVLSGGKMVPTEQLAQFQSKFFYLASMVFVVMGCVVLFTLTDAHRRYIAQLPRWKRFLIWPF